jgi:predicted tellurium resistance membrane protein TerC
MEFTLEAFTALVSLTFMETVLGIDNIIFIAILTGRLPEGERAKARNLGISFALISRLLLLFSLSWIMGLTEPVMTVLGKSLSARDLILLFGGLFLIAKATKEIHDKMEHTEDIHAVNTAPSKKSLWFLLGQIMLLDIVFSLDSVITAVGMAQSIFIMVTAMIISMVIMLASAKGISAFVEKYPTVKILALSFLILIGVFLALEGLGSHIDKNYIYFAMFFAFGVELVNMRFRKKNSK